MRYSRVCIESFGYVVPEEVVSTDEIETRLAPLYQRLRLPEGRLELMSGIRERRFWPAGMLPSEQSVRSGRLAIEAAGIDRSQIGALVHASVCRDHLEPATACRVHHELNLPSNCVIYDASNACLGIMNGMLQVANMIELQQIEAGIVVGTEDCRPLVETTIDALNRDESITRNQVKLAVASMTIGSGSCAVVLTSSARSQTGNRLLAAAAQANTQFHQLCHSGRDEVASDGMRPLMTTDSEKLMRQGIATGAATFEKFLEATDWTRDSIQKTFCHQVGSAHRKMMFEALALDTQLDFTTMEWLGNTGSVALPITMAIGAEQNHLATGDQVALLGIGSGINSLMLGVEWQESRVKGAGPVPVSKTKV